MSTNQQNSGSVATQPRAAVYVNGELLQGMIEVAVDNNAYFQADTFRVDLAISAQPENRGLNFWASLEKAECEICFGYPANPDSFDKSELTSFLVGNTDDIEIDLVQDRITLAGRDLTALLIDARQTLAYVEYQQKSSDIIISIAKQVGLTPVVVATKTPTGVYQNIVHALLQQKASYWDVATKLAQIEAFQIYVKGRELHFEPRGNIQTHVIPGTKPTPEQIAAQQAKVDAAYKIFKQKDDELAAEIANYKLKVQLSQSDRSDLLQDEIAWQRNDIIAKGDAIKDNYRPALEAEYAKLEALKNSGKPPQYVSNGYEINYTPQTEGGAYSSNAMRLMFTRNLTVAKDIHVDVISYNSKTGKVARGHAERVRNFNRVTRGVAKVDGQVANYFYAIPNLDSKEADRRANAILQYLSSHEMNLTADLPGDIVLTPQSVVLVKDTNTPFDQTYYPSSVQRRFSFEEGFRMTLIAKNQSPNNPPN